MVVGEGNGLARLRSVAGAYHGCWEDVRVLSYSPYGKDWKLVAGTALTLRRNPVEEGGLCPTLQYLRYRQPGKPGNLRTRGVARRVLTVGCGKDWGTWVLESTTYVTAGKGRCTRKHRVRHGEFLTMREGIRT